MRTVSNRDPSLRAKTRFDHVRLRLLGFAHRLKGLDVVGVFVGRCCVGCRACRMVYPEQKARNGSLFLVFPGKETFIALDPAACTVGFYVEGFDVAPKGRTSWDRLFGWFRHLCSCGLDERTRS